MKIDREDFIEICRETLLGDGLLRFKARGETMRPFVRSGDILVVRSTRGQPLRRGDVILFIRLNGQLAAHRIVIAGRTNSGRVSYVTKGDSLDYLDFPVNGDDILGKVIALERDGRRINLESTVQRLAGRTWATITRASSGTRRWLRAVRRSGRFFKAIVNFGGFVGFIMRCLQGTAVYRKIGRSASRAVEITETVIELDLDSSEPRYGTTFKAKKGKRTIASATLVHYPLTEFPMNGFFLTHLEVRRLYRGMGIGEMLVRRIRRRCRQEGESTLSLIVNENNRRAIRLFQKSGFVFDDDVAMEERLDEEYRATGVQRRLMKAILNVVPPVTARLLHE